jgi:hypothetical protein
MDTGTKQTPQLTRCLRLNALALAFSLSHVIVDITLFGSGAELSQWASTGIVAVACAVYAWWGWSMAQAAANRRSALPSLLALSGFWAVLHGLTFVWTPITNIFGDVIHFGSLFFGLWAAYATWRALRGGRVAVAQA